MPPSNLTAEQRFWLATQQTPTCWIFTKKGQTQGGYPQFRYQGRTQLAHRVMWQLVFGEIPPDMLVLHRCDNPQCVRPSHLFLGTQLDNVADCIKKGRRRTRSRGNRRLCPEKVRDILNRFAAGETNRSALAREYGVSLETICGILKGRLWSKVALEKLSDPVD